jgi:hypothetical protein
MSDHVSARPRRWPRAGVRRSLLFALALAGPVVIVVGLAVPGVEAALRSMLDIELPRWVHNLADMLQIATALIAFLAWEGTRRSRR